jgi:hypothetical protein
MDGTPPPTGSRIQDLGDHLVVRFRPQRSWGEVLFVPVWLAGWTFGGILVVGHVASDPWSDRAFLLFWLCGWAVGEAAVIVVISWQLFGRELLTVTPEQLEVRKMIGRFAQTKRYEVALVEDIQAARVPSDDDEPPRKDFCLKLSCGGRRLRIGEGMGEREAEYVASTILDRIRPRRWSGEENKLGTPPRAVGGESEYPKRAIAILAGILLAALLLGGLAVALFTPDRSAPKSSPAPAAAPVVDGIRTVQDSNRPPSQASFSNAAYFASAMTRFSLTSARAKVLGRPACDERPTWRQWSCTVTARATLPPFADRTLLYRCSAMTMPQPGGRPPVAGVLCGPEHPPPVGG